MLVMEELIVDMQLVLHQFLAMVPVRHIQWPEVSTIMYLYSLVSRPFWPGSKLTRSSVFKFKECNSTHTIYPPPR